MVRVLALDDLGCTRTGNIPTENPPGMKRDFGFSFFLPAQHFVHANIHVELNKRNQKIPRMCCTGRNRICCGCSGSSKGVCYTGRKCFRPKDRYNHRWTCSYLNTDACAVDSSTDCIHRYIQPHARHQSRRSRIRV